MKVIKPFKFRILGLVLALALATASSVWAQSDRGNGGDVTTHDHREAWLVGPAGESFRYCVMKSEQFKISDERFANRLNRALKEWRRLFWKAGVSNESDPDPRRWYPLYSAKQVPCDGTEHLTFYLGATDAVVDVVKKQYRNPTAFHFRLKAAGQNGTGKGFIWLANPNSIHAATGQACSNGVCRSIAFPDWTANDELLDMFLIHELGHAYGIPHIEGTIMAENLVQLVTVYGKERREIEWSRELISNFPGGAKLYPTRSSLFEPRFPTQDGSQRVFGLLMSRDERRVRVSLAQPDLNPPAMPSFRLLPDLLRFEFNPEDSREQFLNSQEIICIPQRFENASGRCYKNFAWSIPVQVTDERGQVLPGIFEYNLSRRSFDYDPGRLAHPYLLKIYLHGKWVPAFEARF
jgi:hypothetical protein